MSLVSADSLTAPKNPLIRLSPKDNVAVARVGVSAGASVDFEGRTIIAKQAIAAGHKMAVETIAEGATVRKYGETIGLASRGVEAGALVHVHNLQFDISGRSFEFATDERPLDAVPLAKRATFMGYPRSDGRVGTRNFIAVFAASNCAAFATERVEQALEKEDFSEYGIDGVVCLPHADGCGQAEGPDAVQLRRTMEGLAHHPNVAASVMVGLGCEVNQVSYYTRPDAPANGSTPLRGLTLQESGGTQNAVEDAIKAVRELAAQVGRQERAEVGVEHLSVALECGGSDAFSGITANPGVGYFSDLLVRRGGTACLAETTEVYGAEHLLTRRAADRAVGERLLEFIEWYKRYVASFDTGSSFDNNPSPGNKAGGLTNIAEKSLGAVSKGGSTRLMGVYGYAERIDKKGFVFMNTPGYDPPSVAGMVAGGCNICLFTTGRGSCFGFPTAPVIKISSNTETARRMPDDMDINAGTVADGAESIEELGQRIYDFVIDTASGKQTYSEAMGHREFITWRIGPML